MSQTLADAERRCRYHLRDRNPQGQAFTSPEYVHAIENEMREVAGLLLLGESLITLLTLVADTQFYPLTVASQTVESIRQLRTASDGLEIMIVSPEVFDNWRSGDSTTSHSRGRPQIAMFRESQSQITEIGFWPVPDRGDDVEAYRSLLPANFFNAGTGVLSSSPETTNIPFDDEGFGALCYRTSKELFSRMPDADRARLRLAPTTSSEWDTKAASLISASRRRRIHQKLTTGGSRGGRSW